MNGNSANPFKGLAPSQLSLPVYDEGGMFTMNEKRAAYKKQSEQGYA